MLKFCLFISTDVVNDKGAENLVAPSCRFSLRNLLYVTFMAPGILRWCLRFWKICALIVNGSNHTVMNDRKINEWPGQYAESISWGRTDEKHDIFQSVRWFSGEGMNVGGIEYGARSYWVDCDICYFVKLKSCYLWKPVESLDCLLPRPVDIRRKRMNQDVIHPLSPLPFFPVDKTRLWGFV